MKIHATLKIAPNPAPTKNWLATLDIAVVQLPCPAEFNPTKAKKNTTEKMEFIADSIVKKATVASESFIDRDRGTTTAAVVSPPIIDAKMNDGTEGHLKTSTPIDPIIDMLMPT